MPLIAATIQKTMEAAIQAAMNTQFPDGAKADPTSHQKMAAAIAEGVTKVIVAALLSDAVIVPGQATAGGPAAQATTVPGKIM